MIKNNFPNSYLCTMKINIKTIIAAILITFAVNSSYAQAFKAGIIAGIASTDVLGTDALDNDVDYNKIGFNFGLFAQLPLSERNTIEFEMYFIQKGTYSPFPTDTSGAPVYGSHSYKLRLNYMEVPLLFSHRFAFNMGKVIMDKFSIELGPSLGFLVYSGENIDNVGFQPVFTNNYFKAFHTYDVSALIGLVYQISDNWKFHIRYENSLIAIRPHASGQTGFNPVYLYYNPGEVNMVFNYALSYTF